MTIRDPYARRRHLEAHAFFVDGESITSIGKRLGISRTRAKQLIKSGKRIIDQDFDDLNNALGHIVRIKRPAPENKLRALSPENKSLLGR